MWGPRGTYLWKPVWGHHSPIHSPMSVDAAIWGLAYPSTFLQRCSKVRHMLSPFPAKDVIKFSEDWIKHLVSWKKTEQDFLNTPCPQGIKRSYFPPWNQKLYCLVLWGLLEGHCKASQTSRKVWMVEGRGMVVAVSSIEARIATDFSRFGQQPYAI